MSTREIINRCIILGFLVLVGFALAYAIYVKSIVGIVLAMLSMVSAIYFLYLLAKAQQAAERENE